MFFASDKQHIVHRWELNHCLYVSFVNGTSKVTISNVSQLSVIKSLHSSISKDRRPEYVSVINGKHQRGDFSFALNALNGNLIIMMKIDLFYVSSSKWMAPNERYEQWKSKQVVRLLVQALDFLDSSRISTFF